jgi:hypothetical protein
MAMFETNWIVELTASSPDHYHSKGKETKGHQKGPFPMAYSGDFPDCRFPRDQTHRMASGPEIDPNRYSLKFPSGRHGPNSIPAIFPLTQLIALFPADAASACPII